MKRERLVIAGAGLWGVLVLLALQAYYKAGPSAGSDFPPPAASLSPYLLRQRQRYSADTPVVGVSGRDASLGTTRAISYMGQEFWPPDPDGRAHCLGLMFEALIGACEDWALAMSGSTLYQLGTLEVHQFRLFRRDFYQGVPGGMGTKLRAGAAEQRQEKGEQQRPA
ncbi:hypothetical protein EDM76_13875 [bacterium]|nr:MAG: hypothetical protein EDM76_13875 [bacterium]